MSRYLLVTIIKRATAMIAPIVEFVAEYAEPQEFVMDVPLNITFNGHKCLHMIYFHVIDSGVEYKFLMQMDDESLRLSVDNIRTQTDSNLHCFIVNDRPDGLCYFCNRNARWQVEYTGRDEYHFGFGVCMSCVLNPWMMFWHGTVKEIRR